MKKNLFLLFTLIGCCALTALCAGNGVTEEEEIKMVIGETYSQPADTPTTTSRELALGSAQMPMKVAVWPLKRTSAS